MNLPLMECYWKRVNLNLDEPRIDELAERISKNAAGSVTQFMKKFPNDVHRLEISAKNM